MSELKAALLRALPDGLKGAIDQLLDRGLSKNYVANFIGALMDGVDPTSASMLFAIVQVYLEEK